jgi:peptidoglycan biosynthesis protein MviN/MurJ (putative lipid II flippase)
LFLLASSNYWFVWVFSKSFADSVVIFDIFLLMIISRLLFPQAVAVAKLENKAMFYIAIIELMINIVASASLVYYWGLAGIAAGTWLAGLAEKLLIAAYLYRKHRIGLKEYTPLWWWLGYSAFLIVCFGVKYLLL